MAVPTFTVGQVLTAALVNQWLASRAAVKGSNTSRSSTTTLADDPHLTLAVDANCIYVLELGLLYDGATAGDLATGLTGPAGFSSSIILAGLTPSAAGNSDDVMSATTGAAANVGALGAGTLAGALIKGTVTTAGTAGNLTLQWAQVSSSGTATILHSGSWMTLDRIG
jgi:hypothetical protein